MSDSTRNSALPTWLVDPVRPSLELAQARFRPSLSTMTWLIPLMVGIAMLVISVVGWTLDANRFYFAYLIGWVFCLSIAVGAQFFVLIQHLTRAGWSVVVRRIAEALVWSFPLLAILSIPVLLGMHDLYHWTHHDVMDPADSHFDPILYGKRGYLNTPFFLIRLAIYFFAWSFIGYKLYTSSVRQDATGDPSTPARQRKISAIGLPIMAVTTAFASYDLLMSLDPHWFSTIFGVYFFGASFWTVHAFIALVAILLQRNNDLSGIVKPDHYHDLGKFMFGFTVFWAYIAFSQYMLIWYGNLPEETLWYRHRLEHGWQYHSAILLVAHFIIPFWVLLTKGAKRSKAIMFVMAIWFMIMNWFDIHWIAMPVQSKNVAGFHWIDFACWLGLFGLFVGVFLWRLARHPLVPQRDPNLNKSLALENLV